MNAITTCGLVFKLKVVKICYFSMAAVSVLFLLETFLPIQLF
jgi:hypothetical protein